MRISLTVRLVTPRYRITIQRGAIRGRIFHIGGTPSSDGCGARPRREALAPCSNGFSYPLKGVL
jgi:hypothetical protein